MNKTLPALLVLLLFTVFANAQTVTVDCKTLKPSVSTTASKVTVTCAGVLPTPTPTPKPTPTPTPAGNTPVLPKLINTAYPVQTGRVLVATSSNLQSIIDSANYGDTIVLTAGTSYTGNFVLPQKSGTGWIVIRTSAQDSSFVSVGTRINPSHSGLMAKIVSPNSEAALRTDLGAKGYKLLGLELTISSNLNYGILKLGDGSSVQNSFAKIASDIVVDRCYIHGTPTADVSRGIALNSNDTVVVDSYISEIHGIGFDTQAIGGWNGAGPYKIVNNYLEGAGENVMFGGADPHVQGLVPSDIEISRNHLFKPLSWKVGHPSYAGKHWSVKNSFETKNAKRVLVDNNVFENCWADAQEGFMIVLKSVNQDGTAPWSTSQDITFTNNTLRNSGGGFNILGADNTHQVVRMERLLIKDNKLEGINSSNGGQGRLFQISDITDLIIDFNTSWFGVGDVRNNSGNSLITVYGNPSTRFVFTNNTVAVGEYGVKGDGKSTGLDSINTFFPNATFTKNRLIGAVLSQYPANNTN